MDGVLRLGTNPPVRWVAARPPLTRLLGRKNAWKTKVPGAISHEECTDSELPCVQYTSNTWWTLSSGYYSITYHSGVTDLNKTVR